MHILRYTLFLFLACSLFAQDTFEVTGVGKSPIEAARRKKDKLKNAEMAYQQAERAARKDVARQAIFNVYGDESSMSPEVRQKVEEVTTRGLAIIENYEIVDIEKTETYIRITLSARVSREAILGILTNAGIPPGNETINDLRVYVLTYTVEGIDADPTKPILLKEEIRDNQKHIHSSASASDVTRADTQLSDKTQAAASSNSASMDYRDREARSDEAAYSNQGHLKASASEEGELQAEYQEDSRASAAYTDRQGSSSAAASQASSGKVAGSYSNEAEVDTAHDERAYAKSTQASDTQLQAQSASEKAEYQRDIQAHSKYNRDQHSKSNFSDTSRDYYRLRVYADPTKKGAAQTNEVRAEIEGLFKSEGLLTSTLNIPLMGRTFANEDELIDTVWTTIQKQHPGVNGEHFVAVALNRLTPIKTNSDLNKFGAVLTYRVFRLKDGFQLIPSKSLQGFSGETSTVDSARSDATKNTMLRAKDVIRMDIAQGLKQYTRVSKAEAAFTIVIKNAASPFAAKDLVQQLESAGFEVKRSFKSRTLTFEVPLQGKTAEDVFQAGANFLENRCDFESMTEDRAELVLK